MFSYITSNRSEKSGQSQKNKNQYGGLFKAAKRVLLYTAVCLLLDRSATNVVNQVNAVLPDKVNFQIFEIDGRVDDIIWCGETGYNVYVVLTDQGTVYLSRDKGESWRKLHSNMRETGMGVIDDGQTDVGHIKRMYQSPVDSSLIVFIGSSGINWITEQCGNGLKALNSGKRIHEFQFHPFQRNWATAAGWTNCAEFKTDEPCEIYKEIYLTKDLGASWQFLKNYVFEFSWGSTRKSNSQTFGLREIGKEKLSDSRIFITHDPNMKGHQKTRENWKDSVHLYESTDFFKTMNKVLDAGNSIILTMHYMFVAKAVSKDHVSIYVSRAHAQFLDFKRAKMPSGTQLTDHFTVMDTNHEQVFLFVNDHNVENQVGSLFISDTLGYRFTHSLEHITKGRYAVDFESIKSTSGTYMANKYDITHGESGAATEYVGSKVRPLTEEDISRHENDLDNKNRMNTDRGGMNSKQMGGKNLKLSHGALKELSNFDTKVKTYVSHNKGASWNLIDAPLKDVHGRTLHCYQSDGACSLHLHMYSNNDLGYAPPYSNEASVGVVLSVGNTGNYLDTKKGAAVGTYLSRDGGIKWSQIAEIPLIYDISDHGALLVAAPNTQATTQIRYSWNEGKTWTKLKVSAEPIWVENIIATYESVTQNFILYGTYDKSTENKKAGKMGEKKDDDKKAESERGGDIMVNLDFSGLHQRKCKGADAPGTEKSDFELWSPHDDDRYKSHSQKCHMGQQVTYVRRKQDSECYNGEEYERVVRRIPCLCGESDYECDVNYIMKDGKCSPIKEELKIWDSQIMHHAKEDCELTGYYFKETGYRKIPSNQCYGGLKLDPVKKACSSYIWIANMLSLRSIATSAVVCAVLYYGWPIIEAIILVLPIPDPKNLIEQIKGVFGAILGFIQGFLTSQPRGGQPDHGYQSGLNNAPTSYMEDDDDSDEDVGKPALANSQNINYDDKDDEEMLGAQSSNAQNELIDLGSGNSNQSIPKLSGPKKNK